MPVLSHYLDPVDYGITSLINTYVMLLIPAISLLASALIVVEYYQMEDRDEFASLFSSVSLVPVLPAILLFVPCWAFYSHLAGVLELPLEAKWWALSSFLIALTSIYVETAGSYQVIKKQPRIYAAYSISKTLFEIGLTLLFVVGMEMGWKGRILSWLITSVVFTGFAFWYFNRCGLLTSNIQWKYMWQGIVFGAPLILHTVGKFVINQSDRIFIAKMVSIEEAGIYNVGYTIGTIMMIFSNAFANIFTPFIMERLKTFTALAARQIVNIGYVFGAGMIVVLILLQVGGNVMFRFFISPKYLEGMQYVVWVGLGYMFWGGYMFLSGIIFYYKQGKFLAWIAILNVASNIILNYFLIQRFGSLGATYATAISFLIVFLLTGVRANKLVQLPWGYPLMRLFKNK